MKYAFKNEGRLGAYSQGAFEDINQNFRIYLGNKDKIHLKGFSQISTTATFLKPVGPC